MTEKRTLALDARQWRVLMHDNLDVLKAFVQQTETINEDGLRGIVAHLDNMRMLAGAWYQVSAPKPVAADVPAQAIGGPEKPKRGWPKGKKRNQAAQVVQ